MSTVHDLVREEPTSALRIVTVILLSLSAAWWFTEPGFEPVIVAVAAIAGLLSGEAVSATRRGRPGATSAEAPGLPPAPESTVHSFLATPHTVGRHSVLTALREEASRLTEYGEGRVVCVTGEAGMGKTTVAENFLAEVPAADVTIAWGRCSERLAGAEAYLPLIEALESLLRGPHAEEVGDLMRRVAPTWWATVVPQLQESAGSEAVVPQERLKREIALFLESLTHERPLVLFIEDLHWADIATTDILIYLADRLDRIRALILTTYRPEDMRLDEHPFLLVRPTLEQRGRLREIPLDFLSIENIARYLALEYEGHAFPAGLSEAVHRRTEGSPLFIVALFGHLRDLGVIHAADGTWALTGSVDEVEASFPTTLGSVIARKVERLDDLSRELLSVAAVQGYAFDALVVAEALSMDGSDVEKRLRKLDRDHVFVTRLDDHQLPDGTPTARYEFVHVLYQHGLLEAIGPTQRAAWSRSVAEALLRYDRAGSPALAAEIGLLFEAARDSHRAAIHLHAAARQALRLSAPTEATALCRRALTLLESAPLAPRREELRLRLLTDLGQGLMLTVGWGAPEVIDVYHRARDLGKETGDLAGLPPLMIQGLWYHWTRRDTAEITPLLAELHVVADRLGDPAARQMARWTDANVHFWVGRVTKARPIFDEAMSLYRPGQDNARFEYGQDPWVGTSTYAAWNLCLAGYADQGSALAQECLTAAAALEHPPTIAYGLSVATWVSVMRRDAGEASARAGRCMELAEEHDIPWYLAYAGMQRGWALAQLGQVDTGLAELLTSLEAFERIGAVLSTTHFLALLCDTYVLAGRPREGLEAVDRALAMEVEYEEFTFDAELHRLRGELLQLSGAEGVEVESSYRTAIEIAGEQESQWFELRAATSLARLLREQGRYQEGREILQPRYQWFTEGFDTSDLREAEALLRSVD